MSANLEALQASNRRLHALLDALAPLNAEPVAATPEQLAELFNEILHVGDWLRHNPQDRADPKLRKELDKYRCNVERLQRALPGLQAHLLAERARLEAERSQLEAATAWARATRKTT